MTKYPKVSIIIANYNGGQVLVDCINSVKNINYPNFEVVLVDDNSSDDSLNRAIKIKGKLNLKTVRNKKNLGFVGANNEGVKYATEKYVLLLNNDTSVSKDLLLKLVSEMEKDPTIGAVQPKIRMMDDHSLLDNAGSFLTKSGFLIHWGYGKKDSKEFDKKRILFSAKGACLMTRKEIIDRVGLFDEDFVSYMEESDYCFRVWLAGYKVLYIPTTFIYHKVGFSYTKKMNTISVNYNSFKNRILMLYKNLETKNLILILTSHIFVLLLLSLYYLVKLQFSKSSMIIRAIIWNILNIKKSYIKRQKVQSFRKLSDDELFKNIMQGFNIKEMLMHFAKVEANFRR